LATICPIWSPWQPLLNGKLTGPGFDPQFTQKNLREHAKKTRTTSFAAELIKGLGPDKVVLFSEGEKGI
jgi:hypothetical protein